MRNAGPHPGRLAAMQAPVAGHVMAHETKQEGDVLTMEGFGLLTVLPGGVLDTMPGGTHVMLMDQKGGLKPGQEFPLAVTFGRAGTLEVPAMVGKSSAMRPK
nr:copper chaperone PCu(A)C [Azospirillum sp. TSO22-1]